jgi:excisionase family DNA binding protein
MTQTEINLHTIPETSAFIRVSKSTVRKFIKDGKLNSVRIGKKLFVTEKEISEFINRSTESNQRENG